MTKSLRIREYESSDAEAVSDLIRTTLRISNAPDYPPDVLEPLSEYFSPAKVERLARERAYLVAEEKNGKIVGTAALDGSRLRTFFVHPDRQRKGVGRALLGELERHASAAGLNRLEVESSVTGVPFYEALGYRRTGRVIDGTGGREIQLTKSLAPDIGGEGR